MTLAKTINIKHFTHGATRRLVALTAALSLLVVVGTPQTVHASADDFVITSYDISYRLSRDGRGRSHLHTTETIVANFPLSDQNHGIERAIPLTFDKHTTHLKLVSITDGSQKIPYTTHTKNHNKVYRIGSASTYVHGLQKYVITYDQQDVTKDYSSTSGAQEFYWDTNGTDWRVPIERLSVNVQLEDGLKPLDDHLACYQGVAGSHESCNLIVQGNTYTAQATNLHTGENITLSLGFTPKTFADCQPTLADRLVALWQKLLIATFPIAVICFVWLLRRYKRLTYRKGERDTIVPEYAPPAGASIPIAGKLTNSANKTFGAFLLDMAVRGHIKIYEIESKFLWTRRKDYELEIVKNLDSLQTEEQEILKDVFVDTNVGQRLRVSDIRKNGRTIAARMANNPKLLQTAIRHTYRLQAKDDSKRRTFYKYGNVLLVFGLLTASSWLILAAICAYVCGFTLWPLTDKGLTLHRALEGLKLYIKTAEADRLRYLQGPETAQKVGAPIDTDDKRQLVKLYERVLPYAVLFGVEKQWSKQLGEYYDATQTDPSWYAGTTSGFNALAFGAVVSSFTTASSYTAPGNSSSGGSSGGGSSGGGGGGGGGGGW